jgi:hypothetical protein
MARYVNQMFGGAILVLHQSVANAGLVSQVPRGKSKESGLSVLPFDSFDKSLWRYRENCLACACGDHFIGVARENRKNFRAVSRSEMRATRAYGKFPLARGAAVPKILHNFRA